MQHLKNRKSVMNTFKVTLFQPTQRQFGSGLVNFQTRECKEHHTKLELYWTLNEKLHKSRNCFDMLRLKKVLNVTKGEHFRPHLQHSYKLNLKYLIFIYMLLTYSDLVKSSQDTDKEC